jgi:hypothetical protein
VALPSVRAGKISFRLFALPLNPIDDNPIPSDNEDMTTETVASPAMKLMQAAAENAAKGVRDSEAMRRAAESMDKISEEIRKRNGLLDIAVPYIRELRDQ